MVRVSAWDSHAEILDLFPYLEEEDIRQALQYAAWRVGGGAGAPMEVHGACPRRRGAGCGPESSQGERLTN